MEKTSRLDRCSQILALSALAALGSAHAQEQPLNAQPPAGAYGGQVTFQASIPPPPVAQAPFAVPPAVVGVPASAPPAAPLGQWVNTAQYGWIWVPAGTTTSSVNGVPVAYLYMPAHGWTWYASPWGWGPFVYGPWATRPSPFGFRVWIHGPHGWGWYFGPRAVRRHHGYWSYPAKHRYGRCDYRDGHYFGRGC